MHLCQEGNKYTFTTEQNMIEEMLMLLLPASNIMQQLYLFQVLKRKQISTTLVWLKYMGPAGHSQSFLHASDSIWQWLSCCTKQQLPQHSTFIFNAQPANAQLLHNCCDCAVLDQHSNVNDTHPGTLLACTVQIYYLLRDRTYFTCMFLFFLYMHSCFVFCWEGQIQSILFSEYEDEYQECLSNLQFIPPWGPCSPSQPCTECYVNLYFRYTEY